MSREYDLAKAFPGLATVRRQPVEPWRAEVEAQFQNGAVLIIDADGNPIAWATDAGGCVDQDRPPIRRSRQDIARNAQLLAAAPEMFRVLRMVAAQGPCLLTMLRARDVPVSDGLAAAIRAAELVVKDIGS